MLSAVQADLIKNPARGDLVQDSAEFGRHAVRILPDARASEAGTGICSCIWRIGGHIHLLYLLDEDEQEDLSNDERNELRALVAEIKATRYLSPPLSVW